MWLFTSRTFPKSTWYLQCYQISFLTHYLFWLHLIWLIFYNVWFTTCIYSGSSLYKLPDYWRDTAVSNPHVCWQFSFSEHGFCQIATSQIVILTTTAEKVKVAEKIRPTKTSKLPVSNIFLEVCVIKTFYRGSFKPSNLFEIQHRLT